MIYGYKLKDGSEKDCMVEGVVVKKTWQYSSDEKVASLSKWTDKVSVIRADNIQTAKEKAKKYDDGNASLRTLEDVTEEIPSSLNAEDPLVKELVAKSFSELKDFAKANGFDESEYSKLTRSKLIEYIALGMNDKENA